MALSSIQRVGYHTQGKGRWGVELALFALHLICYSPIQVSTITTGLADIISHGHQVSDNAQYRSEAEYRKRQVRAQRETVETIRRIIGRNPGKLAE